MCQTTHHSQILWQFGDDEAELKRLELQYAEEIEVRFHYEFSKKVEKKAKIQKLPMTEAEFRKAQRNAERQCSRNHGYHDLFVATHSPQQHLNRMPLHTKMSGSLDQGVDVFNAVSSLPEKYREIVVLRFYEGHSVPEIAEKLEISKWTVYQRWEAAKLILEINLRDYGE